jgi:hypothetical protein
MLFCSSAAAGMAACGPVEGDEMLALETSEAAQALTGTAAGPARHELTAWAALPQSARTPGPTSGQFITPANGVVPPFVDAQPVPGWSALLDNEDGTFTAMPDNGFGSKGNSSDYVLGFYKVKPSFKTCADGTTNPGSVVNKSFTAFNDKRGVLKNGVGVDLVITADRPNYFSGGGAGTDSGKPVSPAITAGRLLTGFDFDIESLARAKDGTYWVGEEFGPYILHFDAHGTLIDEPAPHPFLKSPSHPDVLAGTATVTSASSRGFESLAFDHKKRFLYAVPEAAPTVDALRPVPGDERVLEIFEFDTKQKAYTGKKWKYRKDGPQTANAIVIGDMTNLAPDVFVLIERDSLFGANAVVKRLYLINLNATDEGGVLEKRLLIDLLDIDDPQDLGGPLPGLATKKFNMPFDSIESVVSLGAKVLGVAIDTNFPTEDGRSPGVPDSTEFIKLKFERPVASYAPTPRCR